MKLIKFWNYLGFTTFAGLPVWFLFMAEIISFKDVTLSLATGFATVALITFSGEYFTKWYQKKNNTYRIEPFPILATETKLLFMVVTFALWTLIVLSNG